MRRVRSYQLRWEWIAYWWAGALVFILALLIRFYRLSYSPLWLDEIYGYELGQSGIGGILRNSLTDPHPPLYYILQWIAAGFGSIHNEVAWRWLPALSGAFTVAIVYQLARSRVSQISAVLAGVLFAVSPMHLYFSQEGRSSAFVTLLSAISMLLLWRLHQSPQNTRLWIGHFSTSLVGIYCSYSFVLVIGMQLFYLAVIERRWQQMLRYALLFSICCLPLVMPFWMTLSSVAAQHTTSPRTNLLEIAQAIVGGDPVRYGFSWAHHWLLIVPGMLACAGIWFRPASGSRTFTLYYALQCFFPFLFFFGVLAPLLNINLILAEAKQFMVLLPAWFVLVAQGIEHLGQIGYSRIVRSILVVVYGVTLLASAESIQRYWETTKSPEGLAVLEVRTYMQPDDMIVSLHYSLTTALTFYLPDTTTYAHPQQHAGSDISWYITSISRTQPLTAQFDQPISLETIRSHPRIWLLRHHTNSQAIIQSVVHACSIDREWNYDPFRVTLLHNCS